MRPLSFLINERGLPEFIPDFVVVNLQLNDFGLEIVHFNFKAVDAFLQFGALLFRLPILVLIFGTAVLPYEYSL